MNRNVTMHDVARRAGVSQSTVSRVLSHSDSTVPISDETVQRVMDAVRDLGYYPNQFARNLRGQKTRMLAMLIGDISNPYYHLMVRKVQQIAKQHSYDIMIVSSEHERETEQHFWEGLIRRPVDGVFLAPYFMTDVEIDILMQRTGTSVVALSQEIKHPQVDVAFADDFRATYETAKWLVAKHESTRIAFLGVPNTTVGERRWRAFSRALEECNVSMPAEYLECGDFSVSAGEAAMSRLLSLPTPPDVLFACNDLMAIGALTTATDRGIDVPDQVAIVGFDNIPDCVRLRPRLTTIAQYPEQIGETLANALFERIEGKYAGPGRRFEIPCQLIERESA